MRKINLGVLGIILLLSNLAMAGEYKMITDTVYVPQADGITKLEKHAEVCLAFLKNLEASPSFPPMACDVIFKPEYTDFKTPEWKDVDVWENRDLELQLGSQPKNEAEKERRLTIIQDNIRAGMLTHRVASFDIDNDGIPDQVLTRIDGAMCDEKKFKDERNWRHYEIYNPDSRKVDLDKAKFYGSYWHTTSLFSYKGVTYYAFRRLNQRTLFRQK
jgi:hypothetical protein